MASPQTENGYTRIANELLEKILLLDINASEIRVLLTVIRKTYGYNKKEDRISLTQFERYTGLSRPTIVESLKRLVKYALLVKTSLPAYSLQKDWEKWVVKRTLLVKLKPFPSKEDLTKTSKEDLTHKRHKDNTKDNMQSEIANEINSIFDLFYKSINPNINFANKTQRDAAQWLIKKYGLEEIIKITNYAISVQGKKYAPTITTPYQLKDKMSNLGIYIKRQESNKVIKLD